jgi:hypothetical protein
LVLILEFKPSAPPIFAKRKTCRTPFYPHSPGGMQVCR